MKSLIIYLTGATEPAHSEAVKTAFLAAGGVTADLYNISAFNQTVIDYAKTNDYDAIIYSYSGEENYFTLANSNPDIMIFMPSDEYSGDLQQLVLTDLYPSTDDYEFLDNTQSLVSYSNGKICGQIFYIAAQRNCSLSAARICANATKDADGIIDVDLAIAYTGEIKLSVGSLTVVRGSESNFTFTLGRITDATNYEIEIEDVETIQTTELTYDYELTTFGIHRVRYRGYNADLTSEWSEWYSLKYKVLNKLLVKL